MPITKTDQADLQPVDPFDPMDKSRMHVRPSSGHGLHQVFNKDTFDQSVAETSKSSELEAQTPSFWSKVTPWWAGTDIKTQTHTPSTIPSKADASTDASIVTKSEPIPPVPALEAPESNSRDLPVVKPPRFSLNSKENLVERLSQDQLTQSIALLSKRSIEQIMAIVLKAQLELEKDNAHVTESTFNKFQQIKKLQEQTLQEIRDVLEKDEKYAGYFKTAQNITLAASVVSGLAAVAVTFGVAIPVVVTLGTVGPAIAATLTALTSGSKAYFDRRSNEHKSKHSRFKHENQRLEMNLDNTQNRITGNMEMNDAYQEQLIQGFKRFKKMCKIASQK